MAICAIIVGGSAATASPQRYTYQVYESRYGAIGTYSNTIEKSDKATTIATEAHISVSFLGFTFYSQDVSRTERRVGDRLVYFHGITTENGKPFEVDGRAEGNHFIIISPNGRVIAPKMIRSANPWSMNAPGGDMLFMPDSGLVTKANSNGGEETSIMVDGAVRQVRQYQIDAGEEQYKVWMDDGGIPVKFNIQDKDSNVTFTLISLQ